MTDLIDQAPLIIEPSSIQRLPGFISLQERKSGVYGTYFKNTFVKDGKVTHEY